MTGSAITSARQAFDQNNQPNVQIDFTEPGRQGVRADHQAARSTGELAGDRTSLRHRARQPDGVRPQSSTTARTPTASRAAAPRSPATSPSPKPRTSPWCINTGALPVTLDQIESQEVSATLGKDSLRSGASSPASPGWASILVYLLVYYRFLGLVADIALIIYGVLLWGLFNAIPVTLTLPGIAGMILTIGVAADANVVIFERIKEEVRRGKHRALGDQLRLRARLSHDPRRQRADAAHGGRALRVRHGAAQGLRLHADPRRAGEHVHRRARDARSARPAVRLRLLQPAVVHGRARPPTSRSTTKPRLAPPVRIAQPAPTATPASS